MRLLDESISVLLIEDDEVDIKNIKYSFEEFNIKNTLIVATNGKKALDMLYGRDHKKITKPKIIFLDINMPKMNGFEFLKQLQTDKHFSTIPVIIITTSASDSDKKIARTFHVAGYFVKPLNFKKLFPLYQRIINDL